MAPSALVAPSCAAQALIREYRRTTTSDGADGMPAHVTLLWPFVDADAIEETVIARVEDALRPFAPLVFSLEGPARFPGPPGVLYLAPAPADQLVAMTAELVRSFPAYPPYGGRHADVIPHVTVAESNDPSLLDRIASDLAPALPVTETVDEVWLMSHEFSCGWRLVRRFGLD